MEVFKVLVDGEDGQYCQAKFGSESEAEKYMKENEGNWDMPLFISKQIVY